MVDSHTDDRIDKLTLFYLEKTVDISNLTAEEFVKEFRKLRNEIISAMVK